MTAMCATHLPERTDHLDDGDFNTLCRELTGTTLNYVRFELPDASEGRCITITETAATTARYPKAGTTIVPAALCGPDYICPQEGLLRHRRHPFTGWSSAERNSMER